MLIRTTASVCKFITKLRKKKEDKEEMKNNNVKQNITNKRAMAEDLVVLTAEELEYAKKNVDKRSSEE